MKKLVSIVLALVMVLSLGTVAFAANSTNASLIKTYTVNNGTAPAETFNFKFEAVSYKNGDGEIVNNANIPEIANASVSFDALATTSDKNVAIGVNVDDYNLGVYTYKVTEVVPETKTAGVTYSAEELYLVLTVLRNEDNTKYYVANLHYGNVDGSKTTGFTNQYDSGSLTVEKIIKGNSAKMDKEFTFTIEFTAAAGTEIKSTIATSSTSGDSGTWSEDGLTYTVKLSNNDNITLSNIPAGVTYKVSEDKENYTQSVNGNTNGTMNANGDVTVTFTNTLDNEVDTGVTMDTIPYIVVLAVAALGLVAFVANKRRAAEF